MFSIYFYYIRNALQTHVCYPWLRRGTPLRVGEGCASAHGRRRHRSPAAAVRPRQPPTDHDGREDVAAGPDPAPLADFVSRRRRRSGAGSHPGMLLRGADGPRLSCSPAGYLPEESNSIETRCRWVTIAQILQDSSGSNGRTEIMGRMASRAIFLRVAQRGRPTRGPHACMHERAWAAR